jgi:hypothetical protein
LFVLKIKLIQLLQFEKDKTNEHLKNTTNKSIDGSLFKHRIITTIPTESGIKPIRDNRGRLFWSITKLKYLKIISFIFAHKMITNEAI